MKISEQTTWEGLDKKQFPSLKGQHKTDVAVIGGGLAGVLIAYELAKEGRQVCILESNEIGKGVTSYTTAFLTHDLDTELTALIKMFGPNGAKLAWQSHKEAIDRIESIAKSENIECEFIRCPAYTYALSGEDLTLVEAENNAAKTFGYESEMVSSEALNFPQMGAWKLANQAKYHPTKFLYGVVNVLDELGVKIFEKSEATNIKDENGYKVIETVEGQVEAEKVVIATYQPFKNPAETFMKKGMYKSFVFEVAIPAGMIEEALYMDMNNPYNYFRIDAGKMDDGKDRMIIGGQDHRNELKMDADKNFHALQEVLKKIVGDREYTITRKWDSYVLEPSDGLALIGEYDPNEYVVTAFSGNGMTYSAIAGMLISDLIVGSENAWAKIYDPTRVPSLYQIAKKGKDYTEEFFKGAGKNLFNSKKLKPTA